MKTFTEVRFRYGSTCLPCKYLVSVSGGSCAQRAVQLKLVGVDGMSVALSQITVVVKFNVLIIPNHQDQLHDDIFS